MLKMLFSKKISNVIWFLPVSEIKKYARAIIWISIAGNKKIRLLTSMFTIFLKKKKKTSTLLFKKQTNKQEKNLMGHKKCS